MNLEQISKRSLVARHLAIACLLAAATTVCAQDSELQSRPTEIEKTTLTKACQEFEQARVDLDIAQIEKFVLPAATVMFADGKLGRVLLEDLESKSKKKDKRKTEAIRVLYRRIDVVDVSHRNVAQVTELLGAKAHLESGMKLKPRRRTMTWVREPDHPEDWKLAAMHESPYSVWEKSIGSYEEKDKTARYASNSIVFVGSSSIRGWKTLGEDFSGLPVLGRGFGGSQMIDSIMYAHRIVLPYQPRAVAVYAGDNDIGYGKSAQQVFDDFKTFVGTLHATDPKIRIGFIAIKPSIKRWRLWPKMEAANRMVADFAETNPLLTYLDIATPMLDADGKPKPELFVKDGLHMTRHGYELWTSVVLPWAKQ